MPCESITQSTLDIGKLDPVLANLALESLGLAYRVNYFNGALQVRGAPLSDAEKNKVRQAYSAEVVKSSAKKYGWQLEETGPYKYQITKR